MAPPATAPVRIASSAWTRAAPYLRALAIWLASRLVVFIGSAFGELHVKLGNATWLGGASWYHRLLRWDSEWYQIVATTGYSYDGNPTWMQNVVFYPLYPTLSRGLSALGVPIHDAMLLVSNAAAVAAVLLLFRLVRRSHGEGIALSAVALLSFFPASVFLSAGYTESLTLLLAVGFFIAIADGRFLTAAVLAGLASATRSSGVLLSLVLAFELARRLPRRAFLLRAPPLGLLATSGLWLYAGWMAYAFGDPLAFAKAQAAFHENTGFAERLVGALTLAPFRKFDPSDLSPAGLDQYFAVIFLMLIARCFLSRGIDRSMAVFAALVFALPYFTLCGGPAGFISMARFDVVSFPLFVAAATGLQRRPWAGPAIAGVLGGLLLMYTALFSQWQWIG